ncbi:RNA polymerase, subunit H/Rpb5, conserved site-containing protein [Senna tora]|uniref:RNA polymerase, subunit H/Rpb5, conserved site-containing protein n=1 Tax=Senna tora TaxID=362788 RepID=A0A834X4R4_9FABA|nr:RNA polymerase, subunit H/Rpb5, conserved site-containing protein [Senna tora]
MKATKLDSHSVMKLLIYRRKKTESGCKPNRNATPKQKVTPDFSVMSMSCAQVAVSGSFHSNQFKRLARTYSTDAIPNAIPGHLLLPMPNGINSKSWPLKSISLFSNLSGTNSSALSQTSGSLCIAHALMYTLVFGGMSYPLIFTVDLVSLGAKRGAGGCNLNVSFTTHSKHGFLLEMEENIHKVFLFPIRLAEKFSNTDFPLVSPLFAIVYESHVLASVEEDFGSCGLGSVGENDVVGFDYLSGDFSR